MPSAPDAQSQAWRTEALTAVRQLVEKYPDDPDAIYSQAAVHNRFGDSGTAVACWKRCLRLNPEFALAYYCLGWDALEHGECEQSVAYLEKTVELDPKITHAYLLLAEALMELGRMKEAEVPLQEYVRLSPRSSEGHYRLGQVYLHAKQYQAAKQYLLAALEINPRYAAALSSLAQACEGLGEEKQAKEYLAESAELERQGIEPSRQRQQFDRQDRAELLAGVVFAHTDIGRVYGARGDLRQAVQHWRRAAELDPQDLESRQLLVSIYEHSQLYAAALPYLRELSRIQPEDAVHQINIGVLASKLGRFEEAEQAFLRVQQLIPHRHEGFAGLARLYLEANQKVADAQALAQKAVALAPVAANYYLLGLAQSHAGRQQEALESLKRATELDRGNRLYSEAYTALNKKK